MPNWGEHESSEAWKWDYIAFTCGAHYLSIRVINAALKETHQSLS